MVISIRPEYFMCKLTTSFIIQTRTTLLIVKVDAVHNFAKTTHMNQDGLQESRICVEPSHKKTWHSFNVYLDMRQIEFILDDVSKNIIFSPTREKYFDFNNRFIMKAHIGYCIWHDSSTDWTCGKCHITYSSSNQSDSDNVFLFLRAGI